MISGVTDRASRFLFGGHGLPDSQRCEWNKIIETEGVKLGISDCCPFLENKIANDIFYEGMFNGRPCIVKCSSRAPDSIRNEYEMLKRVHSADAAVFPEPYALWTSPDGHKAFVAMEKVKQLESMYGNHRTEFHRIDRSRLDGVEVPKAQSHLTKEAYLRYFVSEVLTVETRAIYSDVDVLCIGKLRPLWETDMQGLPAAAVPEEEHSASRRTRLGLSADGPYFCSGLLLIDLVAWKAARYADKLVSISREYADRLVYADKDVFNVVFDGKVVPLSPVWRRKETG